jgi:hypothetical protein
VRNLRLHGALALFASALALTAGSCAAQPVGELQLVAADQTIENPIRDVFEIVVAGQPFYPDMAAGGSPIESVEWSPGDEIPITFWPNALDEEPIQMTLEIPPDYEAGSTLTLVAEIGDNEVRVFSTSLGYTAEHPRTNPAEAQRIADAAAAQEEAEQVKAAEDAKKDEAETLAAAIRSQASSLGVDIDAADRALDTVLDEDGTIYGDDGTARLTAIAKKYETYTTDALEEIRDGLRDKPYGTDVTSALNERWLKWWDDFVDLHSGRWIAADNGDTVSLTRIGERMEGLWDELGAIFDRLDELKTMKASDL